jgi:DNA-binding NtrC family response regulator
MHIGGRPVDSADLVPGSIIELHSELLLMFVRRPLVLPSHTGPVPVFGQADAASFVGEGPEAWRVRRQIATWAAQRAHVLIQGESGTGKELVARALHAAGGDGLPLVTRNAATIPVALVDAELFGNRRDYPNAGMVERPGLIGAADGGVLLLDEFAELPIDSQTHLLRVMDSGEYHRLGEARSRTSRLRLVGLTSRPLSAIRRDVLARFTARIILPGLDERREDIPLIARHLLGRIDSPRSTLPMTPQLVRSLVRRDYTAHTRQLDRILHRVVLEGTGSLLDVLPDMALPAAPPVARDPGDITAAELQAALDACGGVRDQAWRHLGLSSRHVLKRLLKKHGLVGG